MAQRLAAVPPEAFVFGDEIGQSISSVKTAWRATYDQAGVVDLHFHDLRREQFHDLRREFARRLLESALSCMTFAVFSGMRTSRRHRATCDRRPCGWNAR